MFRCGLKKARWYLDRDLAHIVSGSLDNPETLVIQFLFVPNGPGRANDDYFLHYKSNICCVCGTINSLTRHHVVPYCYRKFFPKELARYNSYDIVLLCVPHHSTYEKVASNLKRELAKKHNAPISGILPTFNPKYSKAESARWALIKHGHKIPEQRRLEMLNQINDWVGERYSFEDLGNVSFATKSGRGVAPLVLPHYNIDDFAIMWRKHFVDIMDPKHLPAHWEIERRIYSERTNLGPRDIALINASAKENA